MIVSRGLGLGSKGSLALAGLGLSLAVIVLPPVDPALPPSGGWAPYTPAVQVVESRRAHVRLSVVSMQALLAKIEAKGSAQLVLLSETSGSIAGSFSVSGAAKATALGVQAGSKLGKYVVSGKQDLSDEEIAAIIATMLGL